MFIILGDCRANRIGQSCLKAGILIATLFNKYDYFKNQPQSETISWQYHGGDIIRPNILVDCGIA